MLKNIDYNYIRSYSSFYQKFQPAIFMTYYFGYGSNMSRTFLEKVRGVTPKSSVLGSLKDHGLIMNLKGPNFIEPSFANIRFERGKKVEGILHEITDTEFNKIVASEGPEYEVVDLPVTTSKMTINARTLIWPTDSKIELPTSRRYLKLLLKAAIHNNLSENYIEEIRRKKTVYYPILSEYFTIYAYLWVKNRAKKVR